MRTLGRRIFDDIAFFVLWIVFFACLFEAIAKAP